MVTKWNNVGHALGLRTPAEPSGIRGRNYFHLFENMNAGDSIFFVADCALQSSVPVRNPQRSGKARATRDENITKDRLLIQFFATKL